MAANLMACEAPLSGGEVCNIGSGSRISIAELCAMIRRITRSSASPQFEPPRPGDVKHSLADLSLAEQHLGYKPKVNFEEGLRLTVEWYRGQHKAAKA